MRSVVCATLLGALAAGSAAAGDVCVDPGAPQCAPTVQAGVDAANPGEVVRVAPGLYREAVRIDTEGITLRGSKGVVIDPSGLPAPASSITVTADDVGLERLGIANGDENGVVVRDAARVRMLALEIVSPDGLCIAMQGATPSASIQHSRLRFCGDSALRAEDADGLALLDSVIEGGDGIDLVGDDIEASRNHLSRMMGQFGVTGANARMTQNRLELCDRIRASGSDLLIAENRVRNGFAILAFGDDLAVERNLVTGVVGNGIQASCGDSCGRARIARNRLSDVSGTGIVVRGATRGGLRVEDNRIVRGGTAAVVLDRSDGVRVDSNRIQQAGGVLTGCVEVIGDENEVLSNRVSDCAGDAISIAGDRNRIEANRVSIGSDDGVDLEAGSGNNVLDNRIAGVSDNGIELSGGVSATQVSGNRSAGLRADFCDGGAGTTGTDSPDTTDGCGDVDD
jgi:hypothetical protein